MTRQTTDIHQVIRTVTENFASVFRRGDAAGVAEFYTGNAMLLPSGHDFVQGRQDIEAFWQKAIDMGVRNAKIDALEIEQHGDTAIDVGTYILSDADSQLMDHGKGVVIWKIEDGVWKIHRDIWTSSVVQR